MSALGPQVPSHFRFAPTLSNPLFRPMQEAKAQGRALRRDLGEAQAKLADLESALASVAREKAAAEEVGVWLLCTG